MMDNYNHISGDGMIKIVNRLKSGETVKCFSCKQGSYKPSYGTDYKTTHCFKCECCGEKINID